MSGNFLRPKPSYLLTDAPACGSLTVPTRLIQLIRYERWCCTTISINYRDSRPIYEQVRDGLRRLIVSGSLPLGEKLRAAAFCASPTLTYGAAAAWGRLHTRKGK